jgi:hypothetical protein
MHSATTEVTLADFSHLPTRCPFIALMPQWDFLDFLAEQGGAIPGFHLRMQAEATGLIEEGGRVVGVRAQTPDGRSRSAPTSWSAATAAIRPCAKAPACGRGLGAPIDVLWFRVCRGPRRPRAAMGRFGAGRSRHARPRRLLAMRLVIPRAASRRCGARARGVPRAHRPRSMPFVRRPRRRAEELGRHQAADRRGRPPAAMARGRACSASATRRTRCRRSAASASTSRSRTRSPPPTLDIHQRVR